MEDLTLKSLSLQEIDSNNPLFLAVESGASQEELEQLISQGADWKELNDCKESILHVAAAAGNLKAVKYFLEKGATVDARNEYGATPVIVATSAPYHFMDIVNLLVKNGTDIHAVDEHGENVLFHAVSNRQPVEALKELENLGVTWDISNNEGQKLIHFAAMSGNMEALQYYVAKGADINARDKNETTPLIYVTWFPPNFIENFEWLVKNGADIHAVDKNGQNALFTSVINGKPVSELKQLIERGCIWNKANKKGQNIAHVAALSGNVEALKYFISLGVNINSKVDENNNNIINLMIYMDASADEIDALIEMGAEWNTPNKFGITVLHFAAQSGNLEAMRYFISKGADINKRCDDGKTPILGTHFAKEGHFLEIVDLLIDNGADVNAVDNDGYNLIFYAVLGGKKISELEHLIGRGADWNLRTVEDQSILFSAIMEENVEALKYFLSKGMEVNAHDAFGRTPLLHACKYAEEQFEEIVEILVKNGADVNAVDKEGKNAVQICKENGKGEPEVEKLVALGCY